MDCRRLVVLFSGLAGWFTISSTALAFQPSPTSPYGYSTEFSDFHQHYKVGDGFFHDTGCTPGPGPGYSCGCPIGAFGSLTAPKASMSGTTLTVEYWIRNAYCNPAGDDPNRPISQNYYINVYWAQQRSWRVTAASSKFFGRV